MAVYRIVQDKILTERDFVGQSGGASAEAFGVEAADAAFQPVGKGRPLTVMIRHVYSGRFPEGGGFFGKGGDVAIISGVKDFDVFAASARALNFVAVNQQPHVHLLGPASFDQGTNIVTYSPAVLADSITLTIEIAVASFPTDLLNSLSSAFTALGGLPLLMPYSGYLLGAGQLVKIAAGFGPSIFDGPVFSITDPINFDVPGSTPATADFRVLASAALQAQRFRYKDGQGLVDAHGALYAGDEAYVVVSLDGRANSRLEKFAPTVASAAVLQRFLQIKDGQQASIDTFVDAMQLASDMKYRQRAQALQAEIAGLQNDPAQKASLSEELTAVLKNIATKELQTL